MPIEESLVRFSDANNNVYELTKVVVIQVEGSKIVRSISELYFKDQLVKERSDGTYKIIVDGEPTIISKISQSAT